MNFLAHATLAREGSDPWLLGNLVADGVKGRIETDNRSALASGVRFHRRMDALIDRDPLTLSLRARAPLALRRVTGIALDIVWDHFLARLKPDPTLNRRVYRVLQTFESDIPASQKMMFAHLCRQHWLEAYEDFDFTCQAVAGVGRRLRGRNLLADLTPWLSQHYGLLEESFQTLWPRLERLARQQHDLLPAAPWPKNA